MSGATVGVIPRRGLMHQARVDAVSVEMETIYSGVTLCGRRFRGWRSWVEDAFGREACEDCAHYARRLEAVR